MTINSKTEKELQRVCQSWWRDLTGIGADGKEDRSRADRKARAELRRVGSIAGGEGDGIDLLQVLAVERFHLLNRRVQEKAPWIDADNVALVAVALAHVERDVGKDNEDAAAPRTAALLGEDDPPRFAEARFKRLIRTSDPAELLPQMIRAIKILDKAAPAGELGASLLLWGPKVKRDWAFAYWRKAYIPAEPSGSNETSEQAA